MASSPSHQLGEAIGSFFESAIIQYLHPIISQKGYYLDHKHSRAARKNKLEVIGIDLYGNKHKLDIVIEKDGSEERFGAPKAFIEVAWRRYVKHSKNKAQEIAGAILPLVQTNANNLPYYAAVLAGDFTENALTQLRSQGFRVLYFNYAEFRSLFSTIGLSIHWEEDTSQEALQSLVNSFHSLDAATNELLFTNFKTMFKERLESFANELCESLDNAISEIIVIPIHGIPHALNSVDIAIDFIMNYNEISSAPILRYEIIIKYNSGDEYIMKCSSKTKAIQFLNQYTS